MNRQSNSPAALNAPATAALQGARSWGDLATAEGWSPEDYALVLAENIRKTGVSLDSQRERLVALARLGGDLPQSGDHAAADALAQHFAVLDALQHRFAGEALLALQGNGPRASEIADRFLNASLKAQRAAMAVLSALKVLRDSQAPGGTPTTITPAPAT